MTCVVFVAHALYVFLDLEGGERDVFEFEVVVSQAVRVARGVLGQGWVGGRKSSFSCQVVGLVFL